MSPTVLLAVVAAVLLAAGVVEMLPAAIAAARRVWGGGRGPAARVRRRWGSGRLRLALAVAAVGGLLVVGAPLPALLLGGGVGGGHAVRGAARSRRRRTVGRGAPLVARAIADGLDAGLPVRRAITEAARTAAVDGPAGEELRIVAARLHAGDPLPSALDRWRVRTAERAHATLVAALLLHGDAGGELADVLRGQAAALERARRQAAEAESAIVQARAAARIVAGIPLVGVAGAVVLAPGAVRALTATPLGTALVVAAVGLHVAALFAVRRLAAGDPG